MMTSPRICLNELANYNHGNLVYKWFDLDDYCSADDYEEAVQEWLESCQHPYGGVCEEWNIADSEDVPERFVGYYSFSAEAFYEWKELSEEEKLAVEYLTEICGYNFKEALARMDSVTVSYQTLEDYVYDLVDEMDLPEIAKRYFDYEAFSRDLLIESSVYEWKEKEVLIFEY